MKIFLPVETGVANYVHALRALGAEPCFTEPERCAALLLPGGADLDPGLFGQEDRGSLGVSLSRDARELRALCQFLAAGKPVFGVCRGLQVLNVALGGTLHQDIPDHRRVEGVDRIHGSHTADPALLALYGARFCVNSSHHQSVDRLGEGLIAVQWADDGTVEAIRHAELPIFAVQWHPERLRTPTDGWKLLERWLDAVSGGAGSL